MKLNKFIDHTLLKANATSDQIDNLCKEAIENDFYSVCVNGSYVKRCLENLKNTNIKIAVVVGFPLGSVTTNTKVFEAKEAINLGADEIDMVINVSKLKDKDYGYVENEIREVKEAIGDKILKVIIETCYLSDEEKVIACKLSIKANADFVKTSTGFGTNGATYDDVKLIKNTVMNKIKIKASGGIKDKATAKKYIELGVERLGTSSGVDIVK
ncbi:deoxyribose-phosphate aldolase [Gemelliphila asaccharolytica]|uniref:Deoxyribose-phosphate aldolase n=1 Tax=Gemelliphila asaccharolytica TaxID=502393 RepID=A0ABR5TLR8_9BACL|nr:deoxyribose-phosphate aldolase [Gemella asaccharolytica]KXB57989.1 deoxyribose-phosphate aldolase [Gemella asaccharolytica]